MELTPDCKLVQNLFQKRELLQRGDDRHHGIRPHLLILGGGTAGVSGGGVAIALNRFGLWECFDAVTGVSTGAGIGAYGGCGVEQAIIGNSIYPEECSRLAFINWRRDPIADVGFIASLLRRGPKRLDVEALICSRPQFFVAVSDWESGEGLLLDAKRATPDPIAAIQASTAMRGAYERPVEVNGRYYADGAIDPLPITKVVRRFQPTDMLVIANRTRQQAAVERPSRFEQLLWRMDPRFRRVPKNIRQLVLGRYRRYREGFEELSRLAANGLNAGIIWSPSEVGTFCRNAVRLRLAAEISTGFTLQLLAAAEKKFRSGGSAPS